MTDRLRAVLFDVGGTLLDETLVRSEAELEAMRLERLRTAFGGDRPWFGALARRSFEAEEHDGVPYRQATREVVRRFIQGLGYELSDEGAELVRAARCLPSIYAEAPRPGAYEALRHAKRRGLRVALVTNVLWRTAADSRADWEARGLGDRIDAIVTSIDVGWRKPHPAIFKRALAALRVGASEAVMVGNSRAADVAPAKRLGIRAVLVRSREASVGDVDKGAAGPEEALPPGRSSLEPDAVVDELTALPPVIDRWLGWQA